MKKQHVNARILTFLLIFCFQISLSQTNTEDAFRFIEVTGSAEMNVEPDEIRFEIEIQEYWAEEFEKGKEYKDWVTKIPIKDIESNLRKELNQLGILDEQITLQDVGRNWRSGGKNFRKSKRISIAIKDFKQVNALLLNIKSRGVNDMRIAELKNKDIVNYRKQVKIEAIKAAKEKANYLLESVNNTLGQVISVIELDTNSNFYWKPGDIASNTMLSSSSNETNGLNVRKIKLKYEIKVKFKIK